MPFSVWPASLTKLNASCHCLPCVANICAWTAAMISAKAAGPPQWQAAPPTTAWTFISATSVRVARGSATVTGWPAAFLTVTAYLGAAEGVGARRDLSARGFSGGASTFATTELSAAIGCGRVGCYRFGSNKAAEVRNALEKWEGGIWPSGALGTPASTPNAATRTSAQARCGWDTNGASIPQPAANAARSGPRFPRGPRRTAALPCRG